MKANACEFHQFHRISLTSFPAFTALTLTAALNQKANPILIRELGPVDDAQLIQQ